jgi:DNA-binding NarL/FixJ family response regulator
MTVVEPVRVDLLTSDPLNAAGIAAYARSRPELALIGHDERAEADLRIVCCAGLTSDVVATLRRLAPSGRPVVLITDAITDGDLLTVIECRVVTVLSTAGVTAERLADVAVAVAGRGPAMPPDLVGQLLAQIERIRRDALPHDRSAPVLTGTELNVLRLMADGDSPHEIAQRIRMSTSAVKTISQTMIQRLQLRNRSHAVAYALHNGLI